MSTGPKVRKKLKKKPVKKSTFKNSSLQGFAKLISQGYSEREAAAMARAIKQIKDKE